MTTAPYTGRCQCGVVAYEVDADLDETITCDRSRCRRVGFDFAFAPASAFTLLRGTETVAINVNCLDGVDPRALASRHVRGSAF